MAPRLIAYRSDVTRRAGPIGGARFSFTADTLQMMGGYGHAKEYGIEQKFRGAYGWG